MSHSGYIKSVTYIIFIASALLSLCGCASNPIIIESLNTGPSLTTPISLRVGLYIPNHFRNYVKVIGLGAANSIAVGDALTRGAEQNFKSCFREVVVINESVSDSIIKDFNAVITPEIVDMFLSPAGLYNSKFEITCKWTVVSPNGKIFYMNTITGAGSDNTAYAISRARKFMTLAVEDHYKKLISHMLSTRWWDQK